MKIPTAQRNSSGFTLIELVISASLMSMILASAYVCLRSAIVSQKLIESRADVLQSARVAMALISADLRAACPLSKDFEFIGMHRMLGEVRADNLDFATRHYTPRRPAESDFCEVSYFLGKDAPDAPDFVLWRRRDPTPDPDPLGGGTREEIARGLRGVRFEYYDGFDWYDEWGDADGGRKKLTSRLDHPNLFGMPEAVRITLWFESNLRSKIKTLESVDTKPEAEPPLVFQTTARLDLAAASSSISSSGASTNSVSNSNGQPTSGP